MTSHHALRMPRSLALVLFALASVLLAPGPAYATLVGYWNFDDNVLDHSGTGNHGTLVGALYSSDVPAAIGSGKSLSFTTPDYVHVDAHPSLNSSVFTLAYFVNPNNQSNAGFARVTSRGGDTFETALSTTFRYFNGTWIDTGIGIPSVGWTHVAWRNSATDMQLYINGALAFTGAPDTAVSGLMRIGARHNDSEGFAGLLDDVALWNVTLDPADIFTISQIGVDLFVNPPPPIIPEPSTWLLAAVGGTSLLFRRARRNR